MANPLVGILMGSDSDLPCMQEACKILDQLKVPYECTIVSAHRTPNRVHEYAEEASERGIEVIIAGAGGAAHLPGMLAAHTHLPVIGVPVLSSKLKGLDSLLSIVQMPGGIPVATVAIHNAKNAGLLAAQILGGKHEAIQSAVIEFRSKQTAEVESKASKLESLGYAQYMDEFMN